MHSMTKVRSEITSEEMLLHFSLSSVKGTDEKEEFKHSGHIPSCIFISYFF